MTGARVVGGVVVGGGRRASSFERPSSWLLTPSAMTATNAQIRRRATGEGMLPLVGIPMERGYGPPTGGCVAPGQRVGYPARTRTTGDVARPWFDCISAAVQPHLAEAGPSLLVAADVDVRTL